MKKGTVITILIVLAVTVLGGFLRFYKNTQDPPSMNGDEISIGYAAYSVLKTGHDEHGKLLPLTFESVGDYKNPLFVYLMVPSIKIFGLTDFAIRFPNALMGTVTIPIFFLFLLDIFKKKNIALIGSFLLSVSAWHIFYARMAYETLTASLFVLLGIWFFIKMLNGKTIWAVLSAFFLTLTMYTAPAPRLFVPVFVAVALIVNFPKLKKNLKSLWVFVPICIALGLPMVYATLFQGSGTRLSMVLISNDIEFIRHILLKYFDSVKDIPLLFFFWVERYISYFHPDFIFANGLHLTTFNSFGLGLLYLFEIPWLILGIFSFAKRKVPNKNIFVIWLLTGIVPDSITNNQQHGGRLLHILPVITVLTTLGLIEFVKWIWSLKSSFVKIAVSLAYIIFIVLVLIHAYLVIAIHFPRDMGESFDEGLKQAALFVGHHQNEYKEIVFDTRHGVDAPTMISNPYLYLLFYLKYDPHLYQTESKTFGTFNNPNYHFGKYTFRYIDWHTDCFKKDTLFIGSPWSFPANLAGVNVLDTIRLTNGSIAYYAVTSNFFCPYNN